MADTYLTKDGDVLDWVLWKYYGTTANREVERVLEANPGLADYGAVLPGGVRILLPELETPVTTTIGVRLWD
jgi:phage tail protein X